VKKISFLLLFLIAFLIRTTAQDNLMSLLDQNEKPKIDYTTATFKTTRIVIGQSAEIAPKVIYCL